MKWFNPDKGFGFVELTDGSGEAFLHIRQVEAAGHSTLPSGTTLVVQVSPGQKGSEVTGRPMRSAVGVWPALAKPPQSSEVSA